MREKNIGNLSIYYIYAICDMYSRNIYAFLPHIPLYIQFSKSIYSDMFQICPKNGGQII